MTSEWREKQVLDYLEILKKLEGHIADDFHRQQIALTIWQEFQKPNLKAQAPKDREPF